MKIRLKLLLVVFITLVQSCKKDIFKLDRLAANQWDPEFAVALVNGSVGINDLNLTNNAYLQIGNDKSVSIVYTSNVTKYNAQDFIPAITSTPLVYNFTLSPIETAAFALAPIGSTVSSTATQSVDVTAQTNIKMDIDSIILKTGVVTIDIQNNFSHAGNIVVTLPRVKNGGTVVSKSSPIAANGKSTITIDVANLLGDLTKGGTTVNYLEANYTINFAKGSSTNYTGNITFTSRIVNPTLKLVYGDVKQQSFFNLSADSIPINIFQFSKNTGTINLNDAQVKLNFTNSFGIASGLSFTQVKGYNTNSGNSFFLNAAGITPKPFIVTAPAAVGQTAYSTMTLDKTNPPTGAGGLNLPDFFSKLPSAFTPQFSAQTNPTGVPKAAYKNFISDTSKASIDGTVTIPLDGKVSNFLIKDTFDFTFSDVSQVESFILRTSFNNGLPVGLTANLIFVDNAYNPVYTLDGTTHPILAAAAVDAAGKVTSKTLTVSDFTLGSSIVKKLGSVKRVIYSAAVSSVNNGTQSTKIYADYSIDVKMGVKAKLKS